MFSTTDDGDGPETEDDDMGGTGTYDGPEAEDDGPETDESYGGNFLTRC